MLFILFITENMVLNISLSSLDTKYLLLNEFFFNNIPKLDNLAVYYVVYPCLHIQFFVNVLQNQINLQTDIMGDHSEIYQCWNWYAFSEDKRR